MKWTLCLLISILSVKRVSSQCDSTYFRYTATLLYDVHVIDTNTIVAVGGNDIIKSTNGGISWRNIDSHLSSSGLVSLQFPADSVGYAIGGYKTVLKTEDQGETWYPLYVNLLSGYTNVYSAFNDLFFFDKDRGFLVGEDGKLVATTDGGKTWKDTTFDYSSSLGSITFVNDSLGFICGNSNQLYKTTNGGRQWTKINVDFIGYNQPLTKIKFADNMRGFALGQSGICIKTTDGGTTWTRITLPVIGNYGYGDICFIDPLRGFITSGSSVLKTSDGGNTWTFTSTPSSPWLSFRGMHASKDGKKIVAAGGGGRAIIASTDRGATFQPISFLGQQQLYDLFFLSDATGYLSAEGNMVFKTSDYGESWKPLQQIPAASSGQARKLFFIDSLNGYGLTDRVCRTTDGGISWTQVTTPGGTITGIPEIYFYNLLTGLLQTSNQIYKTVDGGNSWNVVATATVSTFLTAFTVAPGGKVYAVGYGGQAITSNDQGSTWTPVNLTTTKYLTGVYFYTNQVGFIGTGDTTIFKTTDGGTSWTPIHINTYTNLQLKYFKFFNDSTGYMVGNNGGGISWIFKTSNGGLSWVEVREEHTNVYRVAGVSTLYMTGDYGYILKTAKLQPPGIPGPIYGPEKACINNKSVYITGTMAGVNYNWVLSGGGTQAIGANKDTVLWNTLGTYNLSVSATNVCGTSAMRQTSVEVVQFQPGITIQDSLLTATEGLSYQWFLNGSFIGTAQGGTARSIIGRTSGNYTVQVKSVLGCTVLSQPVSYAALVITNVCPNSNVVLTNNFFAATYQWQRDTGTGYINIGNDINFTGVNTRTLTITNAPSSWYGQKFKCATTGLNVTSDAFTLRFINYWKGTAGSAWENGTNWSCNKLPDANTDVVMSSGTAVISSNVTIRKLTVNPAASLTVQTGNTLTITH